MKRNSLAFTDGISASTQNIEKLRGLRKNWKEL
jgi:hypothetical protein